MKTRYEFIYFEKIADKPKTSVWNCRNIKSGDVLGIVRWYPSWRQYTFEPRDDTVYSVGCMADIQEFIGQLRK